MRFGKGGRGGDRYSLRTRPKLANPRAQNRYRVAPTRERKKHTYFVNSTALRSLLHRPNAICSQDLLMQIDLL